MQTAIRILSPLVLLVLLALTFRARLHNAAEVRHADGSIHFIEGDCYSRMTRAKMVGEGRWLIRHHDFENWPQGTTPHTTAPMDWLIVGLERVMRFASPREQSLDLAGAIVSPLLGVLTAAWLWAWAGLLRLPYRALMVLFFALSPILVHGTLLGRPDHQSLLILLLAVAVCSELALGDLGTPARLAKRWAVTAGCAWGLALWVSLYEPAVFFAGAVGRHVIFNRTALFARAVRGRWIALAAILLIALLLDGWRLSLPDRTLKTFFTAWSSAIGELKHLDFKVGVWHWFGVLWLTAAPSLWFAGRMDRRARGLLLLVAVMLALTTWQVRWGYFLALAIAVSLPWQLGVLRRPALGWALGPLAMLPFAWAWSAILLPGDEIRERRAINSAMQDELRNLSALIKGPFLAPWWLSPQIAYWSGQPGIAGTSHQSLAGIVDSARFYLGEDPAEAARILREHGVRYVVLHDIPVADTSPAQYPAVNNAAIILGVDVNPKALGTSLANHPKITPPFLRLVSLEDRGLVLKLQRRKEGGALEKTTVEFYETQMLQLYEVLPEKL